MPQGFQGPLSSHVSKILGIIPCVVRWCSGFCVGLCTLWTAKVWQTGTENMWLLSPKLMMLLLPSGKKAAVQCKGSLCLVKINVVKTVRGIRYCPLPLWEYSSFFSSGKVFSTFCDVAGAMHVWGRCVAIVACSVHNYMWKKAFLGNSLLF